MREREQTGAIKGTPEYEWKKNQKKFLISKITEGSIRMSDKASDRYLSQKISGVNETVKVRGDDVFLQTIDNRGEKPRYEVHMVVSPQEKQALQEASADLEIERTRHIVDANGIELVVDEFDDGTLLARTTFREYPEDTDFTKLPFFKSDVTGNPDWGMREIAKRTGNQ